MEILGALRRKYRSFLPKTRDVVDPESGEVISSLDEEGREILDTTPIAPPVGFLEQPSMFEIVREMVRSEQFKAQMEAEGLESFEEADDFDVDDDFDPNTPYENDFDPSYQELKQAVEEDRRSKAKSKSAAGDQPASGIQPTQSDGSAEPSDPSPQPEGDKA